jgi:phage gpG-like protein
MKATINIRGNTLTPAIRAVLAKGADFTPVMQAGATELVSITKQAFSDPSLRPLPWAPTKQENSILRRSGRMWQSIRVDQVGSTTATIGTDAPYAAAHQFGARAHVISARLKKALFWPGAAHPVKSVKHPGNPPRPFFPFDIIGNVVPPAHARMMTVMSAAIRSYLGL